MMQFVNSFYFYPRPPRGGRQRLQSMVEDLPEISIHALREEGDRPRIPPRDSSRISIHALREEGDLLWEHFVNLMGQFLSTPSARRATSLAKMAIRRVENFYPRPPRGGRPVFTACVSRSWLFLSTPSARRATRSTSTRTCLLIPFLSTPSARRATVPLSPAEQQRLYFYPRPPRGGRLSKVKLIAIDIQISIHALREEGDGTSKQQCTGSKSFLSTPSARRATPALLRYVAFA